MSFNRTKYDSSAYKLEIDRSIKPGDYRIYGSYAENLNQCMAAFGPVGSKADVSITRDPKDLSYKDLSVTESNLSWRRKHLSKDNEDCLDLPVIPKLRHKNICSKLLNIEDSRFTHPIDNYRCMSLTAYQYEPYLHINPQCHIQEDRIGLNSRLYSKDMYILHEQTPWDNFDYPKPKEDKLHICTYKYLC
jgi:hypothetical protein